MIFNEHTRLIGLHAFLSPSSPAWRNYDEEKLDRVFTKAMNAKRGTELHQLANDAIRLGVKLEDNNKTINMFVNDAIGYRMSPEQVLYYSDNCFGTADAISFFRKKLRISDLKTGENPTSFDQLKVYAALFCLEYRFKPFDISMELRIYQNDEVKLEIPEPDEIAHYMDRIVVHDKRINQLRLEALGK